MIKMTRKGFRQIILLIVFAIIFSTANKSLAYASSGNIVEMPRLILDFGSGSGETDEAPASDSIQLLFLITIIALAPSLLVMLTSFTRIIIVLHFVRSALGTQQMPPNQILVGIALFLTLFIMGPVFTEVNETALKPYGAKEITQQEMVERAMVPIREFMFNQVEDKDLGLFVELSGEEYASIEEIPNKVLIPSFILGELSKGFIFGFFIYIPFIVIDMVVASILMAMGMMMLPPAMISLPFKILLFILVDGWAYIIEILAMSFRT